MDSNLSQAIKRKIGKKRLFYVCRDIERAAAGLLLDLPNFFIITNDSPYARLLVKQYRDKIILIKEKTHLDTHELLSRAMITTGDLVMVFKPTVAIEKICADKGWKLLNPSAELANQVEEKISQVRWLGPLQKYLPEYKIKTLKEIEFSKTHFIIQFAHSHTGSGTILIKSKKQLDELRQKFPNRPVRMAKYIKGPLFTNNNIVWDNKILIGNINYQITGIKPFTNLPFATIGNDWALPNQILSTSQIKQYKKIATAVGKKLARAGWKGLFGIDVVVDEKTGKLYLLEINARQPASTTYESELQHQKNKHNHSHFRITTFSAHLAAILKITYFGQKLAAIDSGSQIIQRLTDNQFLKIDKLIIEKNISAFALHGYHTIVYPSGNHEGDWLRLQTVWGVMSGHDKLNDEGEKIVGFIATLTAGKVWNRPRAGVIICDQRKILLMERNKFGNRYFVVPGGTVEFGESVTAAARRETTEETGLSFTFDDSSLFTIKGERDEHYFFATKFDGNPKLGGPENQINRTDNSFRLIWKDVGELKLINLLPPKLKKILTKRFN
ncbi:MAG: NUDIX domain-containing protein [Candidatus Magasanikbacteria bacterium]|jgi:8-oxo-dGTP pyrophosphatase MutT (NUDIX family)/predicted ATP-grasp superfamily ATP-dependent carboligase